MKIENDRVGDEKLLVAGSDKKIYGCYKWFYIMFYRCLSHIKHALNIY